MKTWEWGDDLGGNLGGLKKGRDAPCITRGGWLFLPVLWERERRWEWVLLHGEHTTDKEGPWGGHVPKSQLSVGARLAPFV